MVFTGCSSVESLLGLAILILCLLVVRCSGNGPILLCHPGVEVGKLILLADHDCLSVSLGFLLPDSDSEFWTNCDLEGDK